MSDELFTGDLDLALAQTRRQLATLLRTIHVRADRPSLRALEMKARHDTTPLSKTVVSEMLKGTRLPRKAVMVSFLRACGVPEGEMEPWHRAWERVAASEQDLLGAGVYHPAATLDLVAGDVPGTRPAVRDDTVAHGVPNTRADRREGLTSTSAELAAGQPKDLGQPTPGRPSPGPLIRRRELGALLRALRVSAGLTIEQVAERVLCSPSKVSRMETGFRPVAARDVRDLCDLYQVDDSQRKYLMELSREGRRQGWWQSYDVPYATYIGLEADAIAIDTFQATAVPGLLQTADYAYAILKGSGTEQDHEAIEQGVAVRLTRQHLLTQDNPPQLHAIMDEAALHRLIGGPSVMKAQLDQIIKKSSLPNVHVRIIPYDIGAYPALDSSFTVLELPRPMPGVICIEGLIGAIYLERQQDVEQCQRTFQDMQLIAATEEKSIALIAKTIRDLNSST